MSQTGSAAWGSEMKTKRRIVDAAMLLLLPLLMACSLIGEAFHEAEGTLMLVLFLLHHWMNRAWWKNLFKGRYSPQRVFQTVLNLLLLCIHKQFIYARCPPIWVLRSMAVAPSR